MAHGFKSIKWLRKIVLTNDYKANDTYALQNNDPDSYLKTAAYLGQGSTTFKVGEPLEIHGTAMVGWSGLKRVEYWLQPGTTRYAGGRPRLENGGLASLRAYALARRLAIHPAEGYLSERGLGLQPRDRSTQGLAAPVQRDPWTARPANLAPGSYEFRVRAVDLNGFAQPEPRPYQKSGMNLVPCRTFVVTA